MPRKVAVHAGYELCRVGTAHRGPGYPICRIPSGSVWALPPVDPRRQVFSVLSWHSCVVRQLCWVASPYLSTPLNNRFADAHHGTDVTGCNRQRDYRLLRPEAESHRVCVRCCSEDDPCFPARTGGNEPRIATGSRCPRTRLRRRAPLRSRKGDLIAANGALR
jgi:hypothetical protein